MGCHSCQNVVIYKVMLFHCSCRKVEKLKVVMGLKTDENCLKGIVPWMSTCLQKMLQRPRNVDLILPSHFRGHEHEKRTRIR